MSINTVGVICIIFYALSFLITYERIEWETYHGKVTKLYRAFEVIMYGLTTLVLLLGIMVF